MITVSRAMCSTSRVNIDHLRSQLDQLHSEADITRRKANNARFRLLRLSEAAENLCRQAAVSVRKGKEDYARELLLQKKKIMSALEKSKGRVELFDELAAKLNEAISIKEAQLVRNIASDLEIEGDDAGGPVRIVSPTQDNRKTLDVGNNFTFNQSDAGEDQELVPDVDSDGNMMSYSEAEEAVPESISSGYEAVPESISSGSEAIMYNSLRGPSYYIDFLEDLDQQLGKVENDFMTILELPAGELENEEKPNGFRVQRLENLENIRGARLRIRKFIQEVAGTS
ncbi:uncharacterized protein LOC104902702 [Beta vulgaris subsp. vulgaris]|uniref:uncharacterized protein LOC104902702 n=1 Tax=Beta vulgaris subsp. vulgaris TaxID=3555 RepID=UPI0020372CD4|nr:uncharacterized protein LOC104902702 [Beta vulgaris subsp. vulgaris]XP_048493343.1 uncharacterized protein LOC104902702 [Beta vulgaris subsp. vulgaris]